MLPNRDEKSPSSLAKLIPQCRMPTLAGLRSLSEEEVRLLARCIEEPIEYIDDADFDQEGFEARILQPMPRGPQRRRRPTNDDSGIDLLAVPATEALTGEQELHLFKRLNYTRRAIYRILSDIGDGRIPAARIASLLKWARIVHKTRAQIVRSNLPLVLAMAKRTRITGVDFSDLISEGNLALLRSVDKFDCSRGFKFSTYACRAILKSFSRVAARASRYRGHFPTEFDPSLEKSDFLEQKRVNTENDCVDELRFILGRNLAQLNDVEQKVIRARFALDQAGDVEARGKTLEQVGELIGVTKERVRQIQNKALVKLKVALEDNLLTS